MERRGSSTILFGCAGMKSILTKSTGGEAYCSKKGLAAGWHGNGVSLPAQRKKEASLILYFEER